MKKSAIRVKIKVFNDGDEANAIEGDLNVDIVKSYSGFDVKVPDAYEIREWIKKQVIELMEKRLQSMPDTEILSDINIIEETNSKNSDRQTDEPNIDVVENQETPNRSQLAEEGTPDQSTEVTINISEDSQHTGQAKKKPHLIVRKSALAMAWEHAQTDLSKEAGGIMLGLISENDATVTTIFLGIVRALDAIQSSSWVNFTVDTWANIWNIIDKDKDYSDDSQWKIVGWYHTHPGFSVFLSEMDKFIHGEYFTRLGHIALVIDPKNKDQGFFASDIEPGVIPKLNWVEYLEDKEILQYLEENNSLKLKKLPPCEIPRKEGRRYE